MFDKGPSTIFILMIAIIFPLKFLKEYLDINTCTLQHYECSTNFTRFSRFKIIKSLNANNETNAHPQKL